MKYYKAVENDIITQFARQPNNIIPSFAIEIIKAKHTELSEKIKNRPDDTLEAIYRLSNETETYVPCERTHEETVDWYAQAVSNGEMTLEEVSEEYRAEVEAITGDEATEADYISALAELGVNTSEEG